jgi:hypothetical protein
MSCLRFTPARNGWLALSGCLLAAVSGTFLAIPHTRVAAASGPRQPVLVELFTSEGCSSCPPADALLARLDEQQFVPGAQAIVLSEHVTYWNDGGWRDPFSLDTITDRQQQYAARFGLDSVYTPQAVVDGASQMTGSDTAALTRAIARAASAPRSGAALAIQDAAWSGGTVSFKVTGAAGSDGRLMAALAEDSEKSSVARGENSGRTLRHVAVVRVLQDMGKGAADGRALNLGIPDAGRAAQSGPLRLVVFLADRRSGRVLSVAEQTLTRRDPVGQAE